MDCKGNLNGGRISDKVTWYGTDENADNGYVNYYDEMQSVSDLKSDKVNLSRENIIDIFCFLFIINKDLIFTSKILGINSLNSFRLEDKWFDTSRYGRKVNWWVKWNDEAKKQFYSFDNLSCRYKYHLANKTMEY